MTTVTFPTDVGGDGSQVSDVLGQPGYLGNGGHRTFFVPALFNTVNIANFVKTVSDDIKFIKWQQVRAATTGNISLTGVQTIDGVSLVVGNRVLVKDQTASANNGIYVVASGGWTRALDADAVAEFSRGRSVTVQEGTLNGSTLWVLDSTVATLDTTPISFVKQASTSKGNTFVGNNTFNNAVSMLSTLSVTGAVSGGSLSTTGTLSAGAASVTTLSATGNGSFPSVTTPIVNAVTALALQTGGTTKATLDSAGNLGLGVTPSAFDPAVLTALQVRSASFSAVVSGANDAYFSSNATFNGGSFKYINTGTASQYRHGLGVGSHVWNTAPSGTAGAPITFTQAMTLTQGGNLLVGTTSDNSAFRIISSGNLLAGNDATGSNTSGQTNPTTGTSGIVIRNVVPRATNSRYYALAAINTNAQGPTGTANPPTAVLLQGWSANGSSSSGGIEYDPLDQSLNFLAGSGGGDVQFSDGARRARITSGGNLLVGTASDALHNHGGSVRQLKLSNLGTDVNSQSLLYFTSGFSGAGQSTIGGITAVLPNSSVTGHLGYITFATESGSTNAQPLSYISFANRRAGETAGFERARLTSNGNFLIGVADDQGRRLVADGEISAGQPGVTNNRNGLRIAPVVAGQVEYTLSGIDNSLVFGAGASLDKTANGQYARIAPGGQFLVGATDAGLVGNTSRLIAVGADTNEYALGLYSTNSTFGTRIRFLNNNSTGGAVIGVGAQGDTRQGLQFSSDAHATYFDTNGAERMRITANGNVLIGTTAQNGGVGGAGGLFVGANGASGDPYGAISVTQPADAVSRSYFSMTRAGQRAWSMGIDINNNWTFGTVNTGEGAQSLLNSGQALITNAGFFKSSNGGTYGGNGIGDATNTNYHIFQSNVNTTTLVSLNTSTGSSVVSYDSALPTGSAGLHYSAIVNATLVYRVLANGNVQNTNNAYGGLSDLKLKENIQDAPSFIEKLKRVRIVNYTLKADESQTKLLGVIAQELEEVFPGMVESRPDLVEVTKTRIVEVPAVEEVLDDDGNVVVEAKEASSYEEEYVEKEPNGEVTKSVKYSVFVPMLVKTIQEQQEQIESLEERLARLEAIVAELAK